MISLDDECKDVLEETITTWRERGRRGANETPTGSALDTNVSIPLGPGEWDELLGVPLCVVCQNADKIETLEKEHSWKEEQFDFILQYTRTILLKHGASLIYTMPDASDSLQPLIHSSLGIQSMLKREHLKHNVIDRDRVLVPPNWDSWGKIRILREGFDLEGVSKAWSKDIQISQSATANDGGDIEESDQHHDSTSAVYIYEETIRDPQRISSIVTGLRVIGTNGIEVEALDSQEFLAGQLEILEKLKSDDEQQKADREPRRGTGSFIFREDVESGVVEEHIGPVQFNVGGIQVDADDMLKKLKVGEAHMNLNLILSTLT